VRKVASRVRIGRKRDEAVHIVVVKQGIFFTCLPTGVIGQVVRHELLVLVNIALVQLLHQEPGFPDEC